MDVNNCFETISNLFAEFEKVKTEMKNLIENQKKYYKKGQIYLELKYCGKKDCFFCPHGFVWVVSFNLGKENSLKRKELGKTITHQILKEYNKDFLYSRLKKLELNVKILESKRNLIAGTINKLNRILSNYSKSLNKYDDLYSKEWLSINEAVLLTGKSHTLLYKYIKQKKLEVKTENNLIKIKRSDLIKPK
ncbi:helix-turn-helix domain-containing protein [Deferribacter autotrophicus]|uniref:Helix-turn-helix domain-containing protein n=1 Tax=Deferribacter autotrophicus TaxID=500465 RepID=A0A5A8F0V5_9BACT|nr:helix-turn-helix domain-containing protein [Deferribacter autotrophicus]KAA0257491.1 helix-turn-helix domain-containing protein [Deferribacter autotrophicus]